jgi:hypothetical protein
VVRPDRFTGRAVTYSSSPESGGWCWRRAVAVCRRAVIDGTESSIVGGNEELGGR